MINSRYYKNEEKIDDDLTIKTLRWKKETSCYEGQSDSQRHLMYQREYSNKYKQIKRSALKRNIGFNISFDEFKSLMLKPCFYCNDYPFIIEGRGLVLHGIDRIDSDGAYEMYNIVPCCWMCNRAKHDSDVFEFISMCTKISNNSENIIQQVNEISIEREYNRNQYIEKE